MKRIFVIIDRLLYTVSNINYYSYNQTKNYEKASSIDHFHAVS